jgi:hypothetical protein
MSLNWDLSKIKNVDDILTDEESAINDALIYATMFIGMNEITEQNVDKFFTRLAFYQKAIGSLLIHLKDGEIVGRPIEYNEVVRRIGLHTNASNLSDSAFQKKTYKIFSESVRCS